MPRIPKQEPSFGAFFGLLCLAMFVSLGVMWLLMAIAQFMDRVLP